MSDNAYEILLGETTRQLDKQQGELDQLRSRAASLVGAIAIATTFLGGGLIRLGSLTILSWLAIGSFVVAMVAALWITAGAVRMWCFGYDAERAYSEWLVKAVPPVTVDEMRVELIHRLGEALRSNDRILRLRRRMLAVAGIAIVSEIVFWIVDLN